MENIDEITSKSLKAQGEEKKQVNDAMLYVAHDKLEGLYDSPVTSGQPHQADFREAFGEIIAKNAKIHRDLSTLDPRRDAIKYRQLKRQIKENITRGEKMIAQLTALPQFTDTDIAHFKKLLHSLVIMEDK